MSKVISVRECNDCPCQYDGHCMIGEDVNCDIPIYASPPGGVCGDCGSGGIPEKCPLRKQDAIIKLDKTAIINIGQLKGYNDTANKR